jgi:hypothetical protein
MDKRYETLNPRRSASSEDLLEEKCQLEDEFLEDADLPRSRRRASWKKSFLPVACHIVLIMIYTAVTLFLLDQNNRKWRHGPNLIHCKLHLDHHMLLPILTLMVAPAREALDYERVTFDGFFTSENPYKGPWRPSLDDAWGLLLESVSRSPIINPGAKRSQIRISLSLKKTWKQLTKRLSKFRTVLDI